MTDEDTEDEGYSGTPMPQHTGGLGYYRRLRPFTIEKWYVVDVVTGERLGYLRDTYAPGDAEGYAIGTTNAVVPSDKMMAANEALDSEESAWVAADRLWTLAFPVKSRMWLGLRALVLGSDWLVGFATTVARVAILVLVAAFVFGSIGFLWEARELVQDIIINWLEKVRG